MKRRSTGMWRLPALACLLVLSHAAGAGKDVYLSVPDFIDQTFEGESPEPQTLWLDSDERERAEALAGEDPGFRQRYWRAGERTAWVLEAIGRSHPITMGWVVEDGAIRKLEILVYRESRGWEVRYPFYTKQFRKARLQDGKLSRDIDGISGATLSVEATQRLAKLALWLHEQIMSASSE